jgi:hypothetical protein
MGTHALCTLAACVARLRCHPGSHHKPGPQVTWDKRGEPPCRGRAAVDMGHGHSRLARSASRWTSPGKENSGGGSETQEAVEDGRGTRRTKEEERKGCGASERDVNRDVKERET